MCLCFNLYGRFHRHIIELCWLKSNNYGVLRGPSSNTKVAPSLGSHSKTISRPSLHLLVIRAVLLGLEFHLRVLILLVQAKTSHIPDLQGVEIHPKVEGSSVSSMGNRGTASGNRNKAILMEETVEQICEDDIPIYNHPYNE